jgi:hypothetical protein
MTAHPSDSPGKGETSLVTSTGHTPALVRTGKTLAQLETSIAHYPPEIRSEVQWLQGFYLGDHCRNNAELLRSICAKLGHDKSREYLANLIGGHYFTNKAGTWKKGGKGWSEFLEMMAALRRHAQLLARTGKLPFVQTPTYHCIANFITAKRAPSAVCRIGGIIADTGGQTSESFRFYQSLNNHGAVIHFEAPSNGRPTALRNKMLEQYSVSGCKVERRGELEARAHVNDGRCIIIDNAQVLYVAHHGRHQPAFNWLRELYDDRRPTIILKFTKEFLEDMTSQAALGYFEQFIGRMGGLSSLLRLPDYAPASDLRCIARAFHLAPSAVDEYLYKWSRQQGRIRIVFDKLQFAQEEATSAGSPRITLEHLKAADEYTPPSTGTDEEIEVES